MHVGEAEVVRQPLGRRRPRPGEERRVLVLVAAVALDVVDEDADAVKGAVLVGRRHRIAPRERDVLRRHVDPAELGQGRAELAVAEEGRRRLQDAGEAPARDAVDEQTDEQALVEQRRPDLDGRARQQQQRQDIVVDAQAQSRQGDGEPEADAEDGVQREVARQPSLEPHEPGLAEDDEHEDDDDDRQRRLGPRLAQVARRQTRDRDGAEGVVRERADPAPAQPEDRLLDLGPQAQQRPSYAVAVDDDGDEGGRQEAAQQDRDDGVVVRQVRRVRRQADVEEDPDRDRREEDGRRGREERREAGEDDRDGEQLPPEVPAFGPHVRVEGEGLGEGRIEVGAGDAVAAAADVAVSLADQTDDAAPAAAVADDAGVDRGRADERVPAVDALRRRTGLVRPHRVSADDELLVYQLLRADGMWVQELRAGAVGRTSERDALIAEGAAVVPVRATSVPRSPVRRRPRQR